MIRALPVALFSGAVFLNFFFLFFGYSGLFPLDHIDFSFFAALSFFFALYRPGWAFLLFVSTLSFETINLLPEVFSVSVRPYQLAGAAILAGLFVRFLRNRRSFPFARLRWFDALPLVFALGGFLACFFVAGFGEAFKQAMVVFSFVALYFLSRQFFGDARDARRVFSFFAISSVCAALFALWQSFRFTSGLSSFEVMPGRPNAFFAEPDWLGMFFVFVGSLALVCLFYFLEKSYFEKRKEFGIWKKEFYEKSGDSDRYGDVSSHFLFFVLSFLFLTLFILGLLLTAARSAWIGFALSSLSFLAILLVGRYLPDPRGLRWGLFVRGGIMVLSSFALALFFVWMFRLTTFDLWSRAGSSVSGMQEITVSCGAPVSIPERIENVSELSLYDCRHIRLEDIEMEQLSGKFILTVLRPDPSIEARRDIREKTLETLREHWLFGIGWGNIGNILGMDERGASFNASNAFLEAWLGGGILAFLAFAALWILFPIFAVRVLFSFASDGDSGLLSRTVAAFFLFAWLGGTFFNFFNSGILLGFLWVWLGGIGMIAPSIRERR